MRLAAGKDSLPFCEGFLHLIVSLTGQIFFFFSFVRLHLSVASLNFLDNGALFRNHFVHVYFIENCLCGPADLVFQVSR